MAVDWLNSIGGIQFNISSCLGLTVFLIWLVWREHQVGFPRRPLARNCMFPQKPVREVQHSMVQWWLAKFRGGLGEDPHIWIERSWRRAIHTRIGRAGRIGPLHISEGLSENKWYTPWNHSSLSRHVQCVPTVCVCTTETFRAQKTSWHY